MNAGIHFSVPEPDFGGKGLQISTEWRMLIHGNASFPLLFSNSHKFSRSCCKNGFPRRGKELSRIVEGRGYATVLAND